MTPREQLLKVLPCVICRARYSVNDSMHGLFHAETMVCHPCYANLQERPARDCCFGKPDQYDSTSPDCSERCVDRNICPQYIDGSILTFIERGAQRAATLDQEVKQELKEKQALRKGTRYPFHGEPGLAIVFRDCLQGTTREQLERRLVDLALPFRASMQKLVRGRYGAFRWQYQETQDGQIKITGISRR